MESITATAAPLGPDLVELSEHARRRFRERCRPALPAPAAELELRRLLAEHALISPRPPAWLEGRQRQEGDAYALIGDDIVLPLRRLATGAARLIALTCLTRTGISDAARNRRNRRAQASRARRRARRRGGGGRPRPERRWAA